jgi:hypothetical protein
VAIWDDDDKNPWKQFQTRDGAPMGHAVERTMIESVGGQNTIRTKIRDNPDGTKTTLRTRGGFADFVTSEVEQEKPKPRTYYCAAIPVDVAATDGLIVDSGSLSGFSALVGETAPVSAELDITATAVKYKYNRRWVNNTLALPNKLHPGNRNWFDGRAEIVRQTDSVVSWWCPFMTTGEMAYSWFERQPWIGDARVTKEKFFRFEGGEPLAGTWNSSKGYVFVDGELKCDFGKHVWAAALDAVGQRIVAVVTQSVDLSDAGYGAISTPDFLLVAYNLVNKTYSEIANLSDGWLQERRSPRPVFNHDASEVLISLYTYGDESSKLQRVAVATGGKTLFRSVVETQSGVIDRIATARYDTGNNIRTVNERSYYTEATRQKSSWQELVVEGLSVSRYDMTQVLPEGNVGETGFRIDEGSMAHVIADDGQGGYLIAYRRDFIYHVGYTVTAPGEMEASLLEASPHSGVNFTRHSDSDPSLYAWMIHTAAQDIPIYFAKAGHGATDWAPIGMTHPYCRVDDAGGQGFTPRLFSMSMVDSFADVGRQLEIQYFLATSPGGEFTLVGGRMEADDLQEISLSGDWVWGKFEQQKCALLIRDGAASPLPIEWPGAMATINSPIFYARKPVKKG